MKVFFDARMITHPGIGRYIRSIAPLLKNNKDIELIILGNRGIIKQLLGIEDNVIEFNYPIYSFKEQLGFLKIKKIVGNNILHVPHYNIPFWGKFNLVVTIHDLIHIVYPQGARKKLASFYMRYAIKRALQRARKIISVSSSTKESLEKFFGPLSRTIEVIQEGAGDGFSVIRDAASLAQVKNKFHLPEQFVLYVGSIRKHKNIATLIEGFVQLKKKVPMVHLVLVGKISQQFEFTREGVVYLGEVPDEELAAIYNCASVFCNLSLYEGFSLTILEAQKCGLPVVCSDIAPHREIGGNAVLFVAPENIDQIREALYNVLTNRGLRASLIEKGLENVNKFDWNFAASRTFELYKDVNV